MSGPRYKQGVECWALNLRSNGGSPVTENNFLGSFQHSNTADRVYSLPDVTGNILVSSATQTINGLKTIAASVGIRIDDGAPSVTTNKLYNVGGSLYFNGTIIGSGTSSGGSSSESSGSSFSVNQTAHGFSVLMPVYYDITNNIWTKAQANSKDTLATHVVVAVADSDNFTIGQIGKFTVTSHGYAEGYWFTSAETAGAVVQSDSTYSNPVFFVIDVDTIILLNYRPSASEGLFGMSEAVSITGAITLSSTSIGKLHICSGTTSDYAIVLPSPANNNGKYIGFHMSSSLTKVVTLDAGSGYTIDNERYRPMWANEVAILRSDGATWTKVSGKTIPMTVRLYILSTDLTVSAGTSVVANFGVLKSAQSNCPTSFYDTSTFKITALRKGLYNAKVSLYTSGTNTSANLFQNKLVQYSSSGTAINSFVDADYASASSQTTANVTTDTFMEQGDYLKANMCYYNGSYTTRMLYNDNGSGGPFNRFQVTEIPNW